jgi:hypothetical protein
VVSPCAVTRRIGRDRYLTSVAQSRCCAVPVTLLPLHVDPMQAPVFGERAVYGPGDAPKAVRELSSTSWGDKAHTRPASARLEKGIRKESAQAHEYGIHDVLQRIVRNSCIRFARQLNITMFFAMIASVWGGCRYAPALRFARPTP